jgi:hypothetical protein
MLDTEGLILDSLTSDPGTPSEGQIWYNVTDHCFKSYRNSEVKKLSRIPLNGIITVDANNPDADYTTIQAAITAASAGNTIMVAPGTYTEQLTLKDGIHLIGFGSGTSNGTKIYSGTKSSSYDLITMAVSGKAYITNCCIDCYWYGTSGTLRGLYINGGSVELTDCYVFAHADGGSGGGNLFGIYLENNASSSLELHNTKIGAIDYSDNVTCAGIYMLNGYIYVYNTLVESTGASSYSMYINGASSVANIYGSYFFDSTTIVSANSVNSYGDSYFEYVTDTGNKLKFNSNLIGGKEKSITVESPSASEDISWFFTNKAITITEIRAVIYGSPTPTVTWTVKFATLRTAAGTEVITGGTTTTSTGAGDDITTFNDATIPADNHVWLETTASSQCDWLALTLFYTED